MSYLKLKEKSQKKETNIDEKISVSSEKREKSQRKESNIEEKISVSSTPAPSEASIPDMTPSTETSEGSSERRESCVAQPTDEVVPVMPEVDLQVASTTVVEEKVKGKKRRKKVQEVALPETVPGPPMEEPVGESQEDSVMPLVEEDEGRKKIEEDAGVVGPEVMDSVAGRRQSQIDEIRRQSQIDKIRRQSQIDGINQQSQIDEIRRESQIDEISEQSQIDEICQQSQIDKISLQSQIDEISQQSQIDEISQQSQIDEISQQSQIDEISQQSQIDEISQQSQIDEISQQSQIDEISQQSQISERRRSQFSESRQSLIGGTGDIGTAEEECTEKPEVLKEEDEEKEEKSGRGAREVRRAQRGTSNVLALFSQAQIQEFKEAFTMIDVDRDGLIGSGDLYDIFGQIGTMTPENKVIEGMLAEAPGPLNFTTFLGLLGDRMKGTDSEPTLRNAFAMFDKDGKGKLNAESFEYLLMHVGDQFSPDEVKQIWKEIPIDSGKLDYMKFVLLMKRGRDD